MSTIDNLRYATSLITSVSLPRPRISLSGQRAGSPVWDSQRFYEPPSPLPDGRPGDVIRAEPVEAYVVPGVRLRVRAWRVLYRSTSAVGEPTAVSGTVLIPRTPLEGGRGPRPLIGYAIGTHGIGDAAAPIVASPDTTGNQASERSARSTAHERFARAQPLEIRPPCMRAPFASAGRNPPPPRPPPRA